MDKIESFEFNLDITNQEVIYDYVAKEELRRPADGTWDLSLFKGRGSLQHIASEDENEKMRVLLMDESIMLTSLLEKKISPDSEPEKSGKYQSMFDADFGFDDPEASTEFLPRRLLPIYNRGDIVKGYLNLTLKEPFDAKRLKLNFVGQVRVKLRIYHQRGYYDEIKYEKFMEEKRVLWQKTGVDSSDISDKFTLLSTKDAPITSDILAAGAHKYYFEYKIPDDAPQSVSPLVISTHNEGHLQWRLKAEIEVPGTIFRHGHVSTHRGFLVEYPLDVAADREHLQPVSAQETLDTGLLWNSGKVILKADLKKTGHIRGEALPIKIDLHNDSKGDIVSVSARVRMRGKAKTGEGRFSMSNTIDIKSVKVKEGPIPAGAHPVYDWVLPWDFADSSADGRLLPVGQLEESKLLEVKYMVEVTVKRKALHRNLQLEVPIFVGTHDSSNE